MGFVLDTVNTCHATRAGSAAADLRAETRDGIESNGRKRFAVMSKSHLDAVREARERNFQVRVVGRQVIEGLPASGHNGSLQLSDGVFLYSRRIGEVAGCASDGGGESRVGVDLNVERFGFSGHGC